MNNSYEGLDEALLLESLRGGDEGAFTWLVGQYHNSMVRLALSYLQDSAMAEEVVQETWISALRGLKIFEGRSSLKTWIFAILINQAKTRGQRENRLQSISNLEDVFENKPTVDPGRFRSADAETDPNHWAIHPPAWDNIPEEAFLSNELLEVVQGAISILPENQRAVITLRDIEGFSSEEVCNVLGISETNQRVLLHRSRARVREVLETYLNTEN